MLSADQFLPGTENMREAKPHEQTESQFHNRPDVFVHGRYMSMAASEQGYKNMLFSGGPPTQGFHAGSEAAAHERLTNLDAPLHGHAARFFHGRVDPIHMQNTPNKGEWEQGFPAETAHTNPARALPTRRTDDPGREVDQIDEWRLRHHGSYYRNDYEDRGSTSVILPTEEVRYKQRMDFEGQPGRPPAVYERVDHAPRNFNTWRMDVHRALSTGQEVPHHVRATYEASGGVEGSHSNVHSHFESPVVPDVSRKATPDRYQHKDMEIPGLEQARIKALGKQWL